MAAEVGVVNLGLVTRLNVRVFSPRGRLFRICSPATARQAGIGIQTRRQAS